MYHNYKGQQNGGWNRLTQDLVNNGTYLTGSAKPLDTTGDGKFQASEFTNVGNFNRSL
jgi:iron complex outermembrane receptor protein